VNWYACTGRSTRFTSITTAASGVTVNPAAVSADVTASRITAVIGRSVYTRPLSPCARISRPPAATCPLDVRASTTATATACLLPDTFASRPLGTYVGDTLTSGPPPPPPPAHPAHSARPAHHAATNDTRPRRRSDRCAL